MPTSKEQLLDKLNWGSVSGSQEVSRLPSHFLKIECNIDSGRLNDPSPLKFISLVRAHLQDSCFGRYYVGLLTKQKPLSIRAIGSEERSILVVGFEESVEATMFGLRVDSIINEIIDTLNKKN